MISHRYATKTTTFQQPKEAATTMTEVFRSGALAIHVELPRATYLDAERAAKLSDEPVSRVIGRLARRISDDQAGAWVIARRGRHL